MHPEMCIRLLGVGALGEGGSERGREAKGVKNNNRAVKCSDRWQGREEDDFNFLQTILTIAVDRFVWPSISA